MSWPLAAIGDHVANVKSWNPAKLHDKGAFDYIDLGSVNNEEKEVKLSDVVNIFPIDAPSRARQLVKENDVLVATVRPYLNGVALVQPQLDGATASTGYCVLRVNDETLDPRYLYFWVQTSVFIKDMVSKATGANYPAVSDRIIKESKLPLPPLKEQKRIAEILDKADSLRRKRQQSIQLADEFLRAVFLDMFGDPVTNPKGFDVKELKDMAVVTTGNTPSRSESAYYGDYIEWIKSDNINTPSDFLTTASERLSELGYGVGRHVGAGSTLITCIAGSFDCIGNAAYADREVAFNQQINALTPKEGVSSWFLYALVIFSKKHIQAASTNSMKGMVSKGKMEVIKFICPPESLQDEFGKIFSKCRDNRKKMDESKEFINGAFSSLSQQAFTGEL